MRNFLTGKKHFKFYHNAFTAKSYQPIFSSSCRYRPSTGCFVTSPRRRSNPPPMSATARASTISSECSTAARLRQAGPRGTRPQPRRTWVSLSTTTPPSTHCRATTPREVSAARVSAPLLALFLALYYYSACQI